MVGLARVILSEDYGNLSEAFELFRKAAECGNPEGLYYTGYCYLYGYGTERSVENAYSYLKEAQKLGYSDATHLLNSMGAKGLEEDQ